MNTPAFRFFMEHDGYSRAPDETEIDARIRCALESARAEAWAQRDQRRVRACNTAGGKPDMRRRDYWDVAILAAAGAISLLIFCGSARANEWTRAVEVDEPAVTIHTVDRATFTRTMREYGHKPRLGSVGFSVLGKLEGAWTCYVYVLDHRDRETIEHELRHCHGWVHE